MSNGKPFGDEELIDFLRAVLSRLTYDSRFRLTRPYRTTQGDDKIFANLDFVSLPDGCSTNIMEFRLSEMRELSGAAECYEYVEKKLDSANSELLAFLKLEPAP